MSFCPLHLTIHSFIITQGAAGVRILSCPGKSTWPVIISARMQAADQTSTVRQKTTQEKFNNKNENEIYIKGRYYYLSDCSASS